MITDFICHRCGRPVFGQLYALSDGHQTMVPGSEMCYSCWRADAIRRVFGPAFLRWLAIREKILTGNMTA